MLNNALAETRNAVVMAVITHIIMDAFSLLS